MSGKPRFPPGTPSSQKPLARQDNAMKKWIIFPDSLENKTPAYYAQPRFKGFEDKDDPTQNQGAFVLGQNVAFNSAHIPTLRQGYEPVGTEVANSTPVLRAWVYETRNGDQFELKTFNTQVSYFLHGYSTDWSLLLGGLTANLKMDYATIGISTGLTNYCEFCNGTDGFYRFNGAFAQFASATATTLTLQGTQTWAQLGFNYAPQNLGDNTTNWTVTNPVGTTMRFTYNSGTNPNLIVGFAPIGTTIIITGTGFNASNRGTFTATAFNTNYFEVTNSAVIPEAGVVGTSTSPITYDYNYGNTTNRNKIIINGVTATYGGGVQSKILQNVSVDFSATAVNTLVVQSPELMDGTFDNPNLSSVQGSVMSAHDARLHVRLDSKKDVENYSKLDNPFDFSTSPVADGIGGSKEIEFGGPITAYAKLNNLFLILKNKIIKYLQFTASGTRVDVPLWGTLTPGDDRGATLGALTNLSTVATPLGLVFITPDKQLILLTGVTENFQPQFVFLSDPIQPIFDAGDHRSSTAICVNNYLWYSFKSDPSQTFNDVVVRGDFRRQTVTSDGKVIPLMWDLPYVGWFVADWSRVYNATTGKSEVHWHSAINSNTYRVIDSKTDNTNGMTMTLRTWAEGFGRPDCQKSGDYFYIEIFMTESSIITASLLYDEDGVTGVDPFTLRGTDTDNLFNSTIYNVNGASAYGEEQFGSNPSNPTLKKYRYYLETSGNKLFYTISLQLSLSGPGMDFELIRWGYRINQIFEEPDIQYKLKTS